MRMKRCYLALLVVFCAGMAQPVEAQSRRLFVLYEAPLLMGLPQGSGGQKPLKWDFDTAGEDTILGTADDDPFCTPTLTDGCVNEFALDYKDASGAFVEAARVPISACAPFSGSIVTCTAQAPVIPGLGRYASVTWIARVLGRWGSAQVTSGTSNQHDKQGRPGTPKNLRDG